MKQVLTVLLLTALITGIEWGLLTRLITDNNKYKNRVNTAIIKSNGQAISPSELLRLRTIVQSNTRNNLKIQPRQNRQSDGRRSW